MEFQESCTVTFEWTLKDLKELFDSSKGESKSKVTKSARFGGGKWQILFYANSGSSKEGNYSDGGYVSLYLSCEPTADEKEAALADSARWVREGIYKFRFEIRNLGKTMLYNEKEAHSHSFSYKTANWGWAQFVQRDALYYQSISVKSQDAFVIICTITSSSAPPPSSAISTRRTVPKDLLDTFGDLLDDPIYSDLQFIFPRKGQNPRTLWASKRLLRRVEYFDSMFSSGFAEGTNPNGAISLTLRTQNDRLVVENDSESIMEEFEDSDDENDDSMDIDHLGVPETHSVLPVNKSALPETNKEDDERADEHLTGDELSMPSNFGVINSDFTDSPGAEKQYFSNHGHITMVVRDVSYHTYKAVLYYIYTNNILFAPLSSSFSSNRIIREPIPTPLNSVSSTPSEIQGQANLSKLIAPVKPANTRVEWIRDWMKGHPDRPAPCSAKAAYRVADRLDMGDLKERAAQHIFKSLTVDNIALEVFSPFAAAFDEIRKVEIEFFLTHWHDIRASGSMREVWKQIRNGRHPGFEDVWPVMAANLEFRPSKDMLTANASQ